MPVPRPKVWFATSSAGVSDLKEASAADYEVAPAAGEVYRIARVIISIKDESGMTTETFGAATALSTGIELLVKQDGVEYSLTPGHLIKTNMEFGHYCYDVQVLDYDASPTNESLLARWTFTKFGAPIRLEGNAGDKIIVRTNDALNALIEHRWCFQGVVETTKD